MKQLVIVLLVCFFGLTACRERVQYNGYVDADLIYLSSDFPGRLEHLLVKRGQSVSKHQPLFVVEQTSEQLEASGSRYHRKNLSAEKQVIGEQIKYYDTNYQRVLKMLQQHAASQNDVDLAKEQLDIAQHQLEGINFQIEQAKTNTANWVWKSSRKQNRASEAGMIFDTYYTPTEYVAAGQPVVSLITPQQIKIIFFVPEKALANLHLGQGITAVTRHHHSTMKGEISYIANEAQYTPPIIYSREEREKLVFRIEARLVDPNLASVHLGQPVTIELFV